MAAQEKISAVKEVITLLHDNHNHVSLYAALSAACDISKLTAKEAWERLRSMPRDALSLVKGWKSFELKLGKKELAVLPPLLVVNFSLHGFVLTDSALPYMSTLLPEIVKRRDDKEWCDAHVPLIFESYCKLAPLSEHALCTYIDAMLPFGIGSSDEMTVPDAAMLRTCLTSRYAERLTLWLAPSLYEQSGKAVRKRIAGIKLYLDGAVGAKSAAIRGPWLSDGKALFTYTDDELYSVLERISEHETGLAMHAIGELAIEQALSVLERAHRAGIRFAPLRLEHVQFIDRKQAERAKQLGIILSMQPNFSSDSVDYADRLTRHYRERNNPFRMLIDEAGFVPGEDMIFGSDGMPAGIAFAATQALFPPCEGQRLSLAELVQGYGKARGCAGTVTLDIRHDKRCVCITEYKKNSD